jgi:hypothetical protein
MSHEPQKSLEATWDSLIVYGADNVPMVTIDRRTGAVVFGANYAIDDAARVFWTSLGAKAPWVFLLAE